MIKILLQNNIIYGLKENSINDTFYFAPLFKSNVQKRFHLDRFNNLKNYGYDIHWCEKIDFCDFDKAYAWNSYYEKHAFKEKLSISQNRLFELLPFECPDGFSKFRKLVEPMLPDIFDNAYVPVDKQLNDNLDFYFKSPQIVHSYFDTRNQLIGSHFSTNFSYYLSHGHLDVRYLYNRVKEFELRYSSTKSSQWIIFELLWREFFYWHYQKHKSLFFSKNGINGDKNFSKVKIFDFDELHQLDSHPFFKSALRELQTSGYLSNRARQMFASIWINDLNLDWRSGAMLFEEHLIDFDIYSNYGNWMYLAGVGVDPRGKRYFKISKQLENYDPKGEYINFWK